MPARTLLIPLVGLTLIGCTSTHARLDPGPTLDRDGYRRSLVLSPSGAGDDASAWWAGRNDLTRSTIVQDEELLRDRSVRRVYDHVHSHGNRVSDHYHESSYREHVRQR